MGIFFGFVCFVFIISSNSAPDLMTPYGSLFIFHLVRYITLMMTFMGLAIAYVLRVNISVAIIDMQEQYNWSAKTKGMRV